MTDTNFCVVLDTESDTERLGAALAGIIQPGDFLGLEGDLGAGKTCLTRGLLGGLMPAVRVTSPTYTLLNEYPGPPEIPVIIHADLYRLHDEDDLESTGYWDAVADADLLIVEWIDHVPAAWPDAGWSVRLEHLGEKRRAHVSWRGQPRDPRVAELAREWRAPAAMD